MKKSAIPSSTTLFAGLLLGLSKISSVVQVQAVTCPVCPDGTSNVANPSRQLLPSTASQTGVSTCGELQSSIFFGVLFGETACRQYQSRIGVNECGCPKPASTCTLCENGANIPNPSAYIESMAKTCEQLQADILLEKDDCGFYQQFYGPTPCGCAPPAISCPVTCPDGSPYVESNLVLDSDGKPSYSCKDYVNFQKGTTEGENCEVAKLVAAEDCGCSKVSNACTKCAGGTAPTKACDADIPNLLSYIPASSDLCTSFQISTVEACGCETFPDLPKDPTCKLCPDGSFPFKPNEVPPLADQSGPEDDDFLLAKTCEQLYYKAALVVDSDECTEIQSMAPFCGCGETASPSKAPTTPSPTKAPTTPSPTKAPIMPSSPVGYNDPTWKPTNAPAGNNNPSNNEPATKPTGAPVAQSPTSPIPNYPFIAPAGPTIDIPALSPVGPPVIAAPSVGGGSGDSTSPAGSMHGGTMISFMSYGMACILVAYQWVML